MNEITDVWNEGCDLTQRVIETAKVVDLGIGEQVFVVREPTSVGRSEHYYVKNEQPTFADQLDGEGNVIGRIRKHRLEAAFHQIEKEPPQGANAKTSTLTGVHSHLGEQIKKKVGWERRLNS